MKVIEITFDLLYMLWEWIVFAHAPKLDNESQLALFAGVFFVVAWMLAACQYRAAFGR